VDGSWFDIVDAVRNRLPDCPVIPFADVAADELPTDDTDHVVEFSPGRSRTRRLVSLVSEAALWQYQVAYPVPIDESARIEALKAYDIDVAFVGRIRLRSAADGL